MRKIIIVIYYFSVSIFLFISSVYVPYQYAEESGIAYTNNLFSEFKQANKLAYVDESSAAVKRIRNSGYDFQKIEYKKYSGRMGLSVCAIALVLTLLLPFSRLSDVVWIGGFFSILYAYGSMATEFYVVIVILALVTYYFKKKRVSSLRN